MESLLRDLKLAWRASRRSPVSTAAAIALVALGVGINLAVLAIAWGVLLRPLPFAEPSRLVILSLAASDGIDFGIDFEDIEAWSERLRTVETVSAWAEGEVPLRGVGEPRLARAAFVTEDFFEVLAMPPPSGTRWASTSPGTVAVSRRLGNELGVAGEPLGRRLVVGQEVSRVDAVMGSDFDFPSAQVELWIPLSTTFPTSASASLAAARGGHRQTFRLLARRHPGVSLEQLADDMTRVCRDLWQLRGETPRGIVPVVRPLEEALLAPLRPAVFSSLAGAALVLLVTCCNLGLLLLGRAVARRRDMAVHRALGASPWRLARASLIESLLLVGMGTISGLWLARLAITAFARLAADTLPRTAEMLEGGSVGWGPLLRPPVLAAVLGLVLVAAVACALLPMVSSQPRALAPTLRGSDPRTGDRRGGRLFSALVVSQIAVSVVLLCGTTLLVRTVDRLLNDDTGIDPRNVLTARLSLEPDPRIASQTEEAALEAARSRRRQLVATLLERVRALPGVEAAGVGSNLPPIEKPFEIFVTKISDDPKVQDNSQRMGIVSATPGFLEALGARPTTGRFLESGDEVGEHAVLMASATAARFYFPGGRSADRELPYPLPPVARFDHRPTVIGGVEDIKYSGLGQPGAATLYVPWHARPATDAHLVVRIDGGDTTALAAAIRGLLRGLDPNLPMPTIRGLEETMAGSIADRRLRVLLAAGFAGVALAVALVGLFGVLSRTVAEGRRELAVRRALGASRHQVEAMVLGRAAALAGAGIVLGLGATLWLGRGLGALLWGVTPGDPASLVFVALLMVLATLAAAYLPARQAARISPVVMLRGE